MLEQQLSAPHARPAAEPIPDEVPEHLHGRYLEERARFKRRQRQVHYKLSFDEIWLRLNGDEPAASIAKAVGISKQGFCGHMYHAHFKIFFGTLIERGKRITREHKEEVARQAPPSETLAAVMKMLDAEGVPYQREFSAQGVSAYSQHRLLRIYGRLVTVHLITKAFVSNRACPKSTYARVGLQRQHIVETPWHLFAVRIEGYGQRLLVASSKKIDDYLFSGKERADASFYISMKPKKGRLHPKVDLMPPRRLNKK